MIDPLDGFDWPSLYRNYDGLTHRYEADSVYLSGLDSPPQAERELYYTLVNRLENERNSGSGISLSTYEALCYWKLYSQPQCKVSERIRTDGEIREATRAGLVRLSAWLPTHLPHDADRIAELAGDNGTFRIWGMKSSTALPVRMTLLHFVYPEVVPLFDKQVLLAAGVTEKRANNKRRFLREYVSFAWHLEGKHGGAMPQDAPETTLRLVDMALWVIRGGCGH